MKTTIKNNIEELYTLIINSTNYHKTFIDNLGLWQEFYNNRHILIKKNVLNPKLFTIIEFLLTQEHGEIFDYFHSNLIKELGTTQEQLAFELGDSDNKTVSSINKVLNNLMYHDELCEPIKIIKIKDTFGEIKKYTSKTLTLYTIDSLIILLHENFFNLDPEFTKKILEFITKNLVLIQNDIVKNNSMNKDAIFQYFKKIIPIKIFIGQDISKDKLILKVKQHQIKDKIILRRLFENITTETFDLIFKDGLAEFLIFIEKVDYIKEEEKQRIANKIFDNLIENECYIDLLELIIDNNKTPIWKRYLTENKYNQIIIGSLNSEINVLSSDMIKYLLTIKPLKIKNPEEQSEYDITIANFIFQCSYLVRKGQNLNSPPKFDIEAIKTTLYKRYKVDPTTISKEKLTIKRNDTLQEKEAKTVERYIRGIDINLDIAMELLRAHLDSNLKLSLVSAQAIIRSLANELQNILGIKHNGVYFKKSSQTNGSFTNEDLIININYKLVQRLLNTKLPIHQRLKILNTICHEIKHAQIHQKRQNNIWDIEAYEMSKEDVIRKVDPQFYTTNYKKIKEEITARINGIHSMSKLVELFFPKYLTQIQDELIYRLEEEKRLNKEQDSTRTMQFMENITIRFHRGFDLAIRYNPTILKKHPIFKLEYYPNGLPKTYEDIWVSRTEQNKELVDEILKIRYPEITNKHLSSISHK